MLKNFNKNYRNNRNISIFTSISYHSVLTRPPFLFFQHNQQCDTLLPIVPCTHKLKAGIAYLVGQIEGKNLRYRGTIPFCLHIVPWRLVSTFHVFLRMLYWTLLQLKMWNFKYFSNTNDLHHLKACKKTTYKTLPGFFKFFLSYELLNVCFQTSTQDFCEIFAYFSHLKRQ
jgi:hypothetical protein